MNTPGKKVGITLVTVVVLVTIIVVVSSFKDRFAKSEVIVEKELSVEIKDQNNSKDTDGDGLTDWEETLWGTDINNSDSDKDGTKDGEEVAQSRNPRIAGPDDKMASAEEQIENYVPRETDENSLTTKVARTLFSSLLNGDGSMSKEESLEQSKKVIEAAVQEISLTNKYRIEDLTLFEASDKVKLKEYGNNVTRVFLESVKKSAENPDESLKPFSEGFSITSQELALIPVPRELAGVHTDLLNNFYKQAMLFAVFNESDKDPLLSLILIKKLNEVTNGQQLSTEKISKFILDSGIIYNDGEYGTLLYKN